MIMRIEFKQWKLEGLEPRQKQKCCRTAKVGKSIMEELREEDDEEQRFSGTEMWAQFSQLLILIYWCADDLLHLCLPYW